MSAFCVLHFIFMRLYLLYSWGQGEGCMRWLGERVAGLLELYVGAYMV